MRDVRKLEATYKATNCEVNISHRLARRENDQEGQSMEDKQTKTSPYPTQVKIQTQKDQTCIKMPETDQQDNNTEEEEQNKKPPDLQNEEAHMCDVGAGSNIEVICSVYEIQSRNHLFCNKLSS